MLSFLLSLAFGLGHIDTDNLPVDRVMRVVQEVKTQLAQELPQAPSVVIMERAEPTPLGAISYLSGRCVIFINPNPQAWAQWGRFLKSDNQAQWDQILAASAAHEMGHCMRENREFVAQVQLQDPQLRGFSGTGLSAARAEVVLKQELFADTVALAYANRYLGEQGASVMQWLIETREKYDQNDPTHATGRWLRTLDLGKLTGDSTQPLSKAVLQTLKAMPTNQG